MNSKLAYAEFAECRLDPDLQLVSKATEKMKEYCLSRGMRPNVWQEIELATTEGLNNAIEHGCAGKDSGCVTIRWNWVEEMFHVEIADPGSYAPPPGKAELPEDPLAEGGRGQFLIQQLMDVVHHSVAAGTHVLRMEKTVQKPTWTSASISEMESTIESMAEDLSRSYEEISAVFRLAETLATSSGFAEFLEHSLTWLLELVSGEIAYARFTNAETDSLNLVTPASGLTHAMPESLPVTLGCTEWHCVSELTEVTIEDCTALPTSDPLHRPGGSAFVCPIFFQSGVIGCLVVTQRTDHSYFSAGDLGLIRFLADFLGIMRATNTLQEHRQAQQRALRELEIASSIQQTLLPQTFPESPNYRIHGVCQSAQEVGGDFFDALHVADDGILLVIADVMGKGVPAALIATIFRTAVRARLDLALQPGLLLTEVNHQIASDLAQLHMFITAQVAYLSLKDNTVLVANAGHCPLLHRQESAGKVVQITGGGIPLGVLDHFDYDAQKYEVQPGDRLVFLTDGLYEIEHSASDMMGIDSLARAIETIPACAPADFCAHLLAYAKDYSQGKPASDDRTLLTVERIQ